MSDGVAQFSAISSSFVQCMAFSLVLLSLALTFKHAAIKKEKDFPVLFIDLLAGYISLVAFLFGVFSTYWFAKTVGLFEETSRERLTGVAFGALGGFLLLAECSVTLVMFFRRPR